jgi:hypothetical protein
MAGHCCSHLGFCTIPGSHTDDSDHVLVDHRLNDGREGDLFSCGINISPDVINLAHSPITTELDSKVSLTICRGKAR